MPQLLRDLIQDTANLRQDISRLETIHVNSLAKRQEIQSLIDNYFRDVRPSIVTAISPDDLIIQVDTLMQEILILSHKRTAIATFKRLLLNLKRKLIELETLATCGPPQNAGGLTVLQVDSRIIETLAGLIPSAALAYRQALEDLADDRRRSYRGPATDLREALRETLDHLAPDSQVISEKGFQLERDARGPTMKQKVRYILSHRGLPGAVSETSERATESIETVFGSLVRSVYNRSSMSTHTPTDRSEVLRIRDWVRIVLCELLSIQAS
jgi:hypothetical protein